MLTGYKTYLFNGVMASIMIVRVVVPDAEVPSEGTVQGLVDNVDAMLVSLMVVGNLVLRAFTNGPVFWKQ